MKKAFLSIVLTGIIAIVIILSCNKTNNPNTVTSVAPSLNQLFAGLRTTPQNLSVTAGRDTIVFGANGTMLHFYTNSFKTLSGTIITSGTVYLQLIEMYKPGDMIANRATTMANGQILTSGGQVTISATMNGQTVYANVYGIGFNHGNTSYTQMTLFYGTTGNVDSVATWSQSDTSKLGNVANGTTSDTILASGHTIFNFDSCTNFTWVNCDCFHNTDSPLTSVSVILPDTSFNPGNTEAYIVLHNISAWGSAADTTTAVLSNDGAWGTTHYVAATNTLTIKSEGNTSIVPAGVNYELVVITNKNGQYYYWQTSGVVPHNGISVSAVLASDSQGDVAYRLRGL